MVIHKRLFILFCLSAMALAVNSCKKDNQDYLAKYLTTAPWELVSVTVETYKGASQTQSVTLNGNCLIKQRFIFNADKTCSYENFVCKPDTTKGNWQFGEGRIYLNSDIKCKDTTLSGGRDTVDHPFTNAKIETLGAYSLVLSTGDGYYNANTIRVIRRFGFIHQQ